MILIVSSGVVLGLYLVVQLWHLALALLSARELRRERLVTRFGRVEDMLDSDLSPPVSVIVPAHNEAAGIVESVRSMILLRYPRYEVIVVNDGSTDGTLDVLIDAFELVPVTAPTRREVGTEPIRQIYRSRLPVPVVVVDKVKGGKADALNAGLDVAQYPYLMFTDADIVLEPECLLRAMRHVVEDRERTVAVGGNVRPVNGCTVSRGRVVSSRVPAGLLERMQVIEYVRSFISARPGWSRLNALPLISGAMGIFRRDLVAEVGGFASGHLSEDLDLTIRLHRHLREQGVPYRIVYAPDAVVWTEVPSTRRVLRRQRIRWQRGLLTALREHGRVLFNPRYGSLGLIGFPFFLAFELVAPLIEVMGWILIPMTVILGMVDAGVAALMLLVVVSVAAINSLVALMMDDVYALFTNPIDALRVAWLAFGEQLGLRQQTVLWRAEALFRSGRPTVWGDMRRRGVANLSG